MLDPGVVDFDGGTISWDGADLKFVSDPSSGDLAVNGEGFFIVSDTAGTNTLTRSGSFTADPEGRLVNTAGYYLMGYDTINGTSNVTANGFAGLTPVSVFDQALRSTPSTAGQLHANFPSNDPIVAPADLPSGNTATPWQSMIREMATPPRQ